MTLLGYPILLSILKKSRTWRYFNNFLYLKSNNHFHITYFAILILLDLLHKSKIVGASFDNKITP
ncbi:hypothetical protein [Candidatus Tisiphia endosymbiont of Beris chalybata]|uniref:hypothetical protein n=1 Tax=Candidatus Tisiphia endosymbiont of Beris chalybata TaxID=3066262 RepID=UPI00312C9570